MASQIQTYKAVRANVPCQLWAFPEGMEPEDAPQVGLQVSEEMFDVIVGERIEQLTREHERAMRDKCKSELLLTEALNERNAKIRELEDQIEAMNQRAQIAAAGSK